MQLWQQAVSRVIRPEYGCWVLKAKGTGLSLCLQLSAWLCLQPFRRAFCSSKAEGQVTAAHEGPSGLPWGLGHPLTPQPTLCPHTLTLGSSEPWDTFL